MPWLDACIDSGRVKHRAFVKFHNFDPLTPRFTSHTPKPFWPHPTDITDLVELKELLLRLVGGGVIRKAVVAEGIGPLEHAPAVHYLVPGVCHKLELAGGCSRDLAQRFQLVGHELI